MSDPLTPVPVTGIFRKRPVEIRATQWYTNGDHPQDSTDRMQPFMDACEGEVVRYFRHPDVDGDSTHECGFIWNNHGFIDTREGGHAVCPGDWIITDQDVDPDNPRHGHWYYPVKPDVFEATYEVVSLEDSDQLVLPGL